MEHQQGSIQKEQTKNVIAATTSVNALPPQIHIFPSNSTTITGPKHFSDQSQTATFQLTTEINTSYDSTNQLVFINLLNTLNASPGDMIHNTVRARGYGLSYLHLSCELLPDTGDSGHFSSDQLETLTMCGVEPQNINSTINETSTSSYSVESGIVVGMNGDSPEFESSISHGHSSSKTTSVSVKEWAVENAGNLQDQNQKWYWYQNYPFSPFKEGGVSTFKDWWGKAYNNGNDYVEDFPELSQAAQYVSSTLTWAVPLSTLQQTNNRFSVKVDVYAMLYMLLGTKYGSGHHMMYDEELNDSYLTESIDISPLL